MKFLRNTGATALATLMALTLMTGALTACGTGAKSGQLKVGIVQLLDHAALNASREGFLAALADNGYKDGDKIVVDYHNAAGDVSNLSTIADQLINNKCDLILAIATPSAQALSGKTTTIPILGTAITDYVVAGLADSNDKPGGNVSGTTDMNPISDQLDLLVRLVPGVKTVGFVYSSNEDNSRLQIDIAKKYLDSKKIAWKEVTIANSNDVQQAVNSLVDQVDALYLPTDNVLASNMSMVGSVAGAKKVPVICAEQGMVEAGGLATLGIDYYTLGYQTGLMAIKIFEGASVSTMPIEASKEFSYYLNAATVKELGISVPSDLQQYVK